ncbi:MAG: hypothetical protein ACREXV_05600 [Polaromonas sp.]
MYRKHNPFTIADGSTILRAGKFLLTGHRRWRLNAAVGLAFDIRPAVKCKQFSHHDLYPLRIGIGGAFVVVNDGANAAAKESVAGQARETATPRASATPI